MFIKNGTEIYNSLAVGDNEAVTGKFNNFTNYEVLEELDKNEKVMQGGNIDRMSGQNDQSFISADQNLVMPKGQVSLKAYHSDAKGARSV